MSEIKNYLMSIYETKEHTQNKPFDLDNYVGAVQHGLNQDAVIAGRKAKADGDKKLYDKIKMSSKVVVGNGTIKSGEQKLAKKHDPKWIDLY